MKRITIIFVMIIALLGIAATICSYMKEELFEVGTKINYMADRERCFAINEITGDVTQNFIHKGSFYKGSVLGYQKGCYVISVYSNEGNLIILDDIPKNLICRYKEVNLNNGGY